MLKGVIKHSTKKIKPRRMARKEIKKNNKKDKMVYKKEGYVKIKYVGVSPFLLTAQSAGSYLDCRT
jgi:hypothetical protein